MVTAPKRYCINPNSGVLNPKAEVQIAVSYTEYDPAKRNKHKILVKSMFPPDQDTLVLGTGCKWKWSDQWEAIDQNELMGSKLKCVFAMPPNLVEQNNIEEPKYENTRNVVQSAPSPKADGDMSAAVTEIKKLNDQLSQLRQENIVLKEETLRLKRIAAASEKPTDSPSYSSTTVTAVGPSNEALPTTYIYAALIILVLGVMLGKFFL